MSQSTEGAAAGAGRRLARSLLDDYADYLCIDQLGALVGRSHQMPIVAFSLAPGSVNLVFHGASGATYTGREMG
jgi:hypothetical protein